MYQLFLDLDAQEHHIEFPIVYCNARAGQASMDPEKEGLDLEPLFRTLLEHIPAPSHDPDHPLQAHVTNLDASPYVGRLALCRVRHGTIARGSTVAWCKAADGSVERVKITELYVTEALDRVDQSGLAVVDVSDDGDVAQVIPAQETGALLGARMGRTQFFARGHAGALASLRGCRRTRTASPMVRARQAQP